MPNESLGNTYTILAKIGTFLYTLAKSWQNNWQNLFD